MKTLLSYLILLILSFFLLSSCATVPRNIETTTGGISGDYFSPLQILGISSKRTVTLNRPNFNEFEEHYTIEVPVGTEFIIPVMRSFNLAFGKMVTNTVEAHAYGGEAIVHPRGFGHSMVNIYVDRIYAPDYSVSPPKQTATILVQCRLVSDETGRKWFGGTNYHLIYLGKLEENPKIRKFERLYESWKSNPDPELPRRN